MSKEGADFIGRFGRKNVLELAGLLLDFRFAVERQAISKKALREAVTANDISRSLSPTGS
jgi:hypothetical protein